MSEHCPVCGIDVRRHRVNSAGVPRCEPATMSGAGGSAIGNDAARPEASDGGPAPDAMTRGNRSQPPSEPSDLDPYALPEGSSYIEGDPYALAKALTPTQALGVAVSGAFPRLLHHGDCLDVMAAMEPDSIDAIVTDPPYGLEFMGKEWDRLGGGLESTERDADPFAIQRGGSLPFGAAGRRIRYGSSAKSMQQWHEQWAVAALRVAKPGAYLLAFGGTRTVHRMTVALEDAGWLIRDMLVWGYASGFPKSKALLKPAWEPIVMARKPGPLRELDIEGCRIGPPPPSVPQPVSGFASQVFGTPSGRNGEMSEASGRWPANIVLTDPIFDGGWDGVVGGGEAGGGFGVRGASSHIYGGGDGFTAATGERVGYGDTGTYSRFFLIPKASRSDREPVLPGMLEEGRRSTDYGAMRTRECNECGSRAKASGPDARWPNCEHDDWRWVEQHDTGHKGGNRRNVHPTVKPVELMRHLVRLVTPAGGVVLDPFLGSGTTALAAEQEGRQWVGIEREAEYVAIAEARLAGWQRGMGLAG